MAGIYPDLPNNKIPLDVHGGIIIDLATLGQLGDSSLRGLTGESGFVGIGAAGGDRSYAFLFPYSVDISHIYIAGYRASVSSYSTDTTNGIDGTWLSFPSVVPMNGGGAPDQRNSISAISVPDCRAIRIFVDATATQSAYVTSFHIYGQPSAGQNPDRLELWHPTLNQRTSGGFFDWGDVARGSSADKTFRIKNLSDTLTASTVTVSFDTINDASPSFGGTHTVSTDGSIFTSSIVVSSILPGQISPVITVRRSTPSNAQLSLWTTRVKAEAALWTV